MTVAERHVDYTSRGWNLRTNIVLIDFESVQPETLAALERDQFKVIVFVGASQAKVPFEVATALQMALSPD